MIDKAHDLPRSRQAKVLEHQPGLGLLQAAPWSSPEGRGAHEELGAADLRP